MSGSKYLNDEELVKQAANILIDNLGEVEASRFFPMSQAKRKESIKRHKEWQANLDKKDFFDKVFK
ncbi:MAG: hypothetical protein GY866_20190 [Proteobacteria bacterium]|nr:hypothetical protein [Pseudomonadota bacterium]